MGGGVAEVGEAAALAEERMGLFQHRGEPFPPVRDVGVDGMNAAGGDLLDQRRGTLAVVGGEQDGCCAPGG